MCVQGKRHEVVPKLKQDMKAILLTNWKIWIPFQFVNFNFVPQQLQVCWPVLPDTYRHSPEGLQLCHSLCSVADCMCVMCLALDRELPCNTNDNMNVIIAVVLGDVWLLPCIARHRYIFTVCHDSAPSAKKELIWPGS